jgi:anthranilate synthase component 1
MNSLSLERVIDLAAEYRIIPLVRTVFSASETPLTVYEKLASGRAGTFLLESADQGVWSRYSFVGVNTRGTLIKNSDGLVRWHSPTGDPALPEASRVLPDSGLVAIEAMLTEWTASPSSDLPPLTSGLVGFLSWNMVREIELLPSIKAPDYACPDVCLSMVSDMVILDHLTGNLLLVSNIFVTDQTPVADAFEQAETRISDMLDKLAAPSQPFLVDLDRHAPAKTKARITESGFLASIEEAKLHVQRGDVFQVVLSQRFDEPVSASALDCYRVLRSINPSPYMYLLHLEDEAGPFAVVGSSPEALATVSGSKVTMHPIAGSRPRGATTELDNSFAENLIADAKETAEHLMLVDLARNDLLKVCEPSTVEVSEFMQIRRFSHIMHLVSTVEGTLLPKTTSVDVFRATFPAGTLSGAPKPKALEIIERIEAANRGIFGGVVGYFDFAGNSDLAIAIRTAFIRDNVAHIQAGAGVVLDSVAQSEYQETVNKAKATIAAVSAANSMRAVK